MVDLLKRKEDYYHFNPAYYVPSFFTNKYSILQWDEYQDWVAFRSSADMLKQGISLLNSFYYDWMRGKYSSDNWLTSKEIELILKVIECLGGVLGFWLTMEAYLPEEVRNNIYGRIARLYAEVYSPYRPFPNRLHPPTILPPESISTFRRAMGHLELSLSEIDKMIQWRIRPSRQTEREPLIKLIRFLTQLTDIEMYEEASTKYDQSESTNIDQFEWRTIETQAFIYYIFKRCPPILASHPVKIPSGRYEEKLQPERTQADLIKEMEQELSSLPRFVAWTKTLQEYGEVLKIKVKTIKVDDNWKKKNSFDENMRIILNKTHESYCTPRDQIEKEIAERYAKWRKAAGKLPPTWTPA